MNTEEELSANLCKIPTTSVSLKTAPKQNQKKTLSSEWLCPFSSSQWAFIPLGFFCHSNLQINSLGFNETITDVDLGLEQTEKVRRKAQRQLCILKVSPYSFKV